MREEREEGREEMLLSLRERFVREEGSLPIEVMELRTRERAESWESVSRSGTVVILLRDREREVRAVRVVMTEGTEWKRLLSSLSVEREEERRRYETGSFQSWLS